MLLYPKIISRVRDKNPFGRYKSVKISSWLVALVLCLGPLSYSPWHTVVPTNLSFTGILIYHAIFWRSFMLLLFKTLGLLLLEIEHRGSSMFSILSKSDSCSLHDKIPMSNALVNCTNVLCFLGFIYL